MGDPAGEAGGPGCRAPHRAEPRVSALRASIPAARPALPPQGRLPGASERPEICLAILIMSRVRRHQFTILAALCALAMLAVASVRSGDLVLYNHSPSLPVGLYVRAGAPVGPGAIITVRALDVAPEAARQRQFDGPSDRFIKRVAATAGAEVCVDGASLTVDGVIAARIHDSAAAPPGWAGCRALEDGEILLLGDTDDSFDGRYWGPVSAALIEGVWRRL